MELNLLNVLLGTEHFPIIAIKDTRITPILGHSYEVWSAGCICGWLATYPTKYIPSEESAKNLYAAHLRRVGVLSTVEVVSSDSDESGDTDDE